MSRIDPGQGARRRRAASLCLGSFDGAAGPVGVPGLGEWGFGGIRSRENRAFLGRAMRYLAGEARIGQFLGLGTESHGH